VKRDEEVDRGFGGIVLYGGCWYLYSGCSRDCDH